MYNDICWECSSYGDDYFINEDGDLECACYTCCVMLDRMYDDDWDE